MCIVSSLPNIFIDVGELKVYSEINPNQKKQESKTVYSNGNIYIHSKIENCQTDCK